MKDLGIYEWCFPCRKVTPHTKIIIDKITRYICNVCGNKKFKGKRLR